MEATTIVCPLQLLNITSFLRPVRGAMFIALLNIASQGGQRLNERPQAEVRLSELR